MLLKEVCSNLPTHVRLGQATISRAILRHLLDNSPCWVSEAELAEAVWGLHDDGGPLDVKNSITLSIRKMALVPPWRIECYQRRRRLVNEAALVAGGRGVHPQGGP